jgi:hypothetical protein
MNKFAIFFSNEMKMTPLEHTIAEMQCLEQKEKEKISKKEELSWDPVKKAYREMVREIRAVVKNLTEDELERMKKISNG